MIYIAADKHGFRIIRIVENILRKNNAEYENLGVLSANEEMKLEDMIPKVVKSLRKDDKNLAIISCGTGVGVEVGANKFSGVRACLATTPVIAKHSKIYDNCNVLCLVGWKTTKKETEKIVSAWLRSEYDGNEKRLKMIEEFNKWH